jgi:hypothetical protein
MHTAPPPPRHNPPSLRPVGSAPSVSTDWNPGPAWLRSGSSLLPEQFFKSQTSLFTARPVRALLRAVLEDALACVQSQCRTDGRRVQREAQEAEAWYWSQEENWPFSFVTVGAMLGLEPEAIRQQLKRWRRSHLGQAAIEKETA